MRLTLRGIKYIVVIFTLYTFLVTFHLIRRLHVGSEGDLDRLEYHDLIHEAGGSDGTDFNNTMLEQIVREIINNNISRFHNPKRKRRRAGARIIDDEDVDVNYDETYPGYMGQAVSIDVETLSPTDTLMYEQGWKDHHFNQFVSDMIPLTRQLPDLRNPKCGRISYEENLPKMSVIICFHNEAWTTLLRTVHSVLSTTPFEVLQEIILVDDASTMDHLKGNLTRYVNQIQKTFVLRLPERVGLVKARLQGTAIANAEVITFLDSHCECSQGWAEPLLLRVQEDPTIVVWPQIPAIDRDTFQIKVDPKAKINNKGGFYWDMNFRWIPMTKKDRQQRESVISPIRSPTMSGGLFTINKEFFNYIGTYDPNFIQWGAENMEISFKVWMCRGSVEIIPCSLVAHVYRDTSPMNFDPKNIVRNSHRVVEVWLDEYKSIYYENIGMKLKNFGDISEQLDLRERLKCKDFDWYIDNIYPEVFLPVNVKHKGKISPGDKPPLCMSTVKKRAADLPVKLNRCQHASTIQFWYLTEIGELRSSYNCVDAINNSTIKLKECHGKGGNQLWEYTQDGTLRKPYTDLCLTADYKARLVTLRPCDQTHRHQIWKWKDR